MNLDPSFVPVPLTHVGARKLSVLDVQVAYDALVRHCVSSFNTNASLPAAIVSIALGDADGQIEVMGTVEITDFASLTAEGRDGPLMGEFFHQALVSEEFRGQMVADGHRPADMLAFLSEVMVFRATNETGDAEHDEAIMVVIHTAERSFRSLLTIEQGAERKVFYAPLQLDIPFPGLPEDAPATLTLDKMPSSNPALVAAHPLHDLHTQSNAQLH